MRRFPYDRFMCASVVLDKRRFILKRQFYYLFCLFNFFIFGIKKILGFYGVVKTMVSYKVVLTHFHPGYGIGVTSRQVIYKIFHQHIQVAKAVIYRYSSKSRCDIYIIFFWYFFFLSFFFCNIHVWVPCNSVGTNTALCTAKHAAVLMFRHLINAANAQY